MRTYTIASALTTLFFALSAVNAAPVAEADAEPGVHIILERDASLPVHLQEKRQNVVTITVAGPRGGHTHTFTRTRTHHHTHTGSDNAGYTPAADYAPAPAPAPAPDPAPAPPPAPAPAPAPKGHKSSNGGSSSSYTPDTSSSDTSDSSSDSSSDSGAPDADAQTMLDSHNTFRAQNQAGPLTWSSTLADYAQQHASGCVFEHTGGPYGENLAAGYGSIEASIEAWYDEQSEYSFSDPGFSVSSFVKKSLLTVF